MDPWILLRLPLMAFKFWAKHIPPRYLLMGMGASTIAVVVYGCIEGGNW